MATLPAATGHSDNSFTGLQGLIDEAVAVSKMDALKCRCRWQQCHLMPLSPFSWYSALVMATRWYSSLAPKVDMPCQATSEGSDGECTCTCTHVFHAFTLALGSLTWELQVLPGDG